MDLRSIKNLALAFGLLGATGSVASAAPITFTGNVAADMQPSTSQPVYIVQGTAPDAVAQASWMTAAGWITGWNIKDIRFSYDKGSDTLYVGVNTYSIAGNSSGNGTPGIVDPRQAAVGGVDPAHIGGQGSISVAFAPNVASAAGTPVVIAGVPADKSHAGPGLDGFTVSSYVGSNSGIAYSYGTTLTNNQGALAFDPSAAHPNFEFTINKFSTIPGMSSTNGFWIQAFAGSPNDVIAGEDTIGWIKVPGIAAPQIITPEPTTIAAWALLASGAIIGLRRQRRAERTSNQG